VSYSQIVSTSDNYVLVYASKSARFEWYLYRKTYQAYPVGSTQPSSEYMRGYALYAANSGDSVRVVVTYDPVDDQNEG